MATQLSTTSSSFRLTLNFRFLKNFFKRLRTTKNHKVDASRYSNEIIKAKAQHEIQKANAYMYSMFATIR